MAIERDKKEVGGWWMWILLLMVMTGIITTGLGYMGKFTGTIVERAVFENSYQYSEARKTQIAVFEAQLAEISTRLMSGSLSEGAISNLQAQQSALRVQLAAARAQ